MKSPHEPECPRGRAAVICAAIVVACFVGAGLPAPVAAAEAPAPNPSPPPARVHLDYRRDPAAATCISAEQLTADVESRLGRPVFVSAELAELTARVVARRAGARFRVDVVLLDRGQHRLGQRQLTTRARHCSALDESLALVLSLAADMPRERPASPADSASAPTPAEGLGESGLASRSLGTPLTIPEDTPAPRMGMRLRPSLGVTAVAGPLPSLAPGVELGLELRAGNFWPVALRASAWPGQRRELDALDGGARFSALALELSVCPYRVALGSFEASVCAEQWLGRVQADSFGVAEAQHSTGWVLAFGAGVALTRELGPVFVSASAGVLAPVLRRRYFFTGAPDITLYDEPWVQAAGALRVGTEF